MEFKNVNCSLIDLYFEYNNSQYLIPIISLIDNDEIQKLCGIKSNMNVYNKVLEFRRFLSFSYKDIFTIIVNDKFDGYLKAYKYPKKYENNNNNLNFSI